jgi:predicted peptidase
MRKTLHAWLSLPLLFAVMHFAAAETPEPARFVERSVTVDAHTYHYQVFLPRGFDPARKWPVILFLHGSGERGDDNHKQVEVGLGSHIAAHMDDFPAVTVFPQAPEATRWSGAPERAAFAAMVESVREFHGDRRRLYLTGLSMGGYGAWQMALDHPGVFAAMVVVCGGLLPTPELPDLRVTSIPSDTPHPYAEVARRLRRMPIWIFHGELDDVLPPQAARDQYAALMKLHASAKLTMFPEANHNAWDPAYATPELWTWLFAQRRRLFAHWSHRP